MVFLCILKDFRFREILRFRCNKRCSKVIFRALDEKLTHEHVLWRQMTKIANLTPWPRMTLTWPKVTMGLGCCFEVSETQIMPICCHYLRLRSTFLATKPSAGTSVKMLNILSLTWPVTSSVTPRSTKFIFARQFFQGYQMPFAILKSVQLTRALLGYFYNASYWGGTFCLPPLRYPKLLNRS